MVRCPVCESARVVVVVSPTPRAFCVKCTSKWIQEGSLQRQIRYGARPGGIDPLAREPTA